jgi:hypothetical protein
MPADSNNDLKHLWDDGLADDELFLIGKIVAHWGAIEHEVFIQTLQTFNAKGSETIELPRAMNNMNFRKVLELWQRRVVAKAEEPKRCILEAQGKKIESYQDYRNALVHGMWGWEPGHPEVITTTRIKKKNIITTKFNDGDLQDLYTELAQINLYIRYPGGIDDIVKEREEKGFYINEAALRRMSREKSKPS